MMPIYSVYSQKVPINSKVEELGAENILAIVTTTSCLCVSVWS